MSEPYGAEGAQFAEGAQLKSDGWEAEAPLKGV